MPFCSKKYFYISIASEILVIPDGVKRIEKGCFKGSLNLKEVTLPSSLDSIGSLAFFGCISLSSVSIPSSTRTIGDKAFASCYMLERIEMPETVLVVGKNAFKDCRKPGDISSSSILVESDVMDGVKKSTASRIIYED